MALAKFEDTVLQSDSGRAYAGIVVEALSGGEPVQLYRDAGGSEPASQITTNANGLFTFWVGEGTYTIRYSLGGVTLGSQAGVEIYNLVKALDLADEEGAENVGVATGDTLQDFLDTLDQASTQKVNADAIGVSGSDANMGTTPGTILSDNGTAKQWFVEAEAAIEAWDGAAFSQADSYPSGTIRKKLQQTVSIKDAPFNAVGDGVTNDTAAVQAAVAYACANKLVLVGPPGNYRITAPITYTHNFFYRGEGAWFVKDFVSVGYQDALFTNAHYNTTTRTENIVLRDFWLTDTDSTKFGSFFVLVTGKNVLIDGLVTKKRGESWTTAIAGDDIRITNVNMHTAPGNPFGDGIHITQGNNIVIDGGIINSESDDAIAIHPTSGWSVNGQFDGLDNVVVSNMILKSATNSIRIGFSDAGSGGEYSFPIGRVTVSDCHLVHGAQLLDERTSLGVAPSGPITFDNCTFDDDLLVRSPTGTTRYGVLTLDNCKFKDVGSSSAIDISALTVQELRMDNCRVNGYVLLAASQEIFATGCYFKSATVGNAVAADSPSSTFNDCRLIGSGTEFRGFYFHNGGAAAPYVSVKDSRVENVGRAISSVAGITLLEAEGLSTANISAAVFSGTVGTKADAPFSHSDNYVVRTAGKKLQQTIAVTDAPFNADATGATSSTAAFSAAAQATYVSDYLGGALESSLARPSRGYVRVPAGSYVLGSLVDTGGRDIVWLLDPAAVIDAPGNINGTIWRGDGRVTAQNPFGISDYATSFVATTGGSYADKPAPVTGVSTLQQLADYDDRDAVALLGAAYSTAALINVSSATYTATTAVIPSPSANVLKRLRRGMIIDTKHATRCTGIVSSWTTGGGNLTITVAEWRAEGGSSAVTPANGTGLYVSRTTKIWGGNFVANLDAAGDVDQAVGIETTVYNSRGDSSSTIGNTTNRAVGKYVYSAGPYKIQSGFQFAGAAHYGFTALDSENGFYSISAAGKVGAGFISLGYATVLRGINTSGQQTSSLSSSGNLELGNLSASSTPVIDFHSSGNNIDYDSRIIASGGSGSVGQGDLTAQAASFRFSVTQMGFFGNPVVSRQTYGAPTGVANRTTFDTETVTLVELARRIKPLIDDLRSLGLLG